VPLAVPESAGLVRHVRFAAKPTSLPAFDDDEGATRHQAPSLIGLSEWSGIFLPVAASAVSYN